MRKRRKTPTMNDKRVIVVGLVIALVVLTFPFWYTLGAGRPDPPPEFKRADADCVEDDMRARHMSLLNEWRDAVVRDGEKKPYISKAYKTSHKMSLTETCLSGCHATATNPKPASVGEECPTPTRATFCHQCHNYANVQPTCWDCHVEPPKGMNDG
jgi:hypothetical protein